MNKKWYPYLLILVLLIILLIVRVIKGDGDLLQPFRGSQAKSSKAAEVNRDRGFDRRVSFIRYSDHAKCRMQCRKITQKEVEEVMREGKINYRKSDIKNARCPRYALESITSDRQKVRIIFAQCNEWTTVVTAIDLETDYECHCPGDDDKYKNRR